MLQNIHDKAKGWVAYMIVGFIAVPFALFGISSYLDGGSALVAATVNGEDIPARGMQSPRMLDQVISQTLIEQETKSNGYRASNQEVYNVISRDPSFQKEGVFDPETYALVLASRRTNKVNYENSIRDRISNQQFIQAISRSTLVTPQELERYQGLYLQTRDVEMFTIKKSDYASEVTVTDDEVKKHYDTNHSKYMTTEKVKLNYVKLSQDDLASAVTVEGDVLQQFYDENIDRFVEPEQRKVAHILVKIEGQDETKAKEKAAALYEKIKSGAATFESLAKTDSDDSLSADKAGEIGFVAMGDMGQAFDATAFKLEKGAFSEVIKTEAGYEIVKLLDVKEKIQKEFAQVEKEVEKLYRKEQASKLYFDKTEELQTLAFENENGLNEAADAIGAKVSSSDWIERNQSFDPKNPLSRPKIVKAAFSEDVLGANKNSDMIELGSGTAYVIRIKEHKTPTVRPLTEVAEAIKVSLIEQKLRKVVIQKGELVLEKLKQTGDWKALESISGSIDAVVKTSGIKRDDRKMAQNVVEKIFSMQHPKDAKTSFSNAILPDGDYALIGLSAVNSAKPSAPEQMKDKISRTTGTREILAMLKALRDEAEIEIFPENIK